jgi:hypothetical protein
MITNRTLKVFLCHSSNDKPQVRELYNKLLADGFDAWLDEEKLLPGQDWDLEIREVVRQTDIVIVCLSNNSVTKKGYAQKEIKIALDVSDEQPEGAIFLIPAKLEDCQVPHRLSKWHWVNLFESNGYDKLRQSLHAQANAFGASSISPRQQVAKQTIINPGFVEYEHYPWQPFLSFRYLESLDSTRFSDMAKNPGIRVLSAKSELLEALLFGDAIALSENQIIDSRGAIESLSELISGAKEAGVRIPIRVASRIPNQSVFTLASQRVGNIEETQLTQRFVISANPTLDLDVRRRKLWAIYLSQGLNGLDDVLKNSSSSEVDFAKNWFTTLSYVDSDSKLGIGARNIPDRFPHEVKQVLSLTTGDLEDMCKQIRDANVPEIMHPQWFTNNDEADAAAKIIAGLQMIVDQISGVPNARSPIYTKLAELEKTEPLLVEGIREVVDSIYNHTMGLAVHADSLSDTTGGDSRNILVRAGHALSQWVRQTENLSGGGYSYELPWAWGGASQLTWSSKLESELINRVVKDVPWRAILEATKEPSWKESLVNYRTAVDNLQSIDRNSITLGSMGSEWRQKHRDLHNILNEVWQKHIELSAHLISNQTWKLTSDGIQYHLPESGNRPLPAFQNYRTMGTATDYPIEIPLFRTSVIQRMEFEQNIFGVINEIAQKRQH